jgi:hypothetical protein
MVGIGGSSAGAIAACAAAAAEYRRRVTGSGTGFETLDALPGQLKGAGRLPGLFRPDRATRREHRLLLRALKASSRGRLGWTWLAVRAAWLAAGPRKGLQRIADNDLGLCTGMALDNPPGEGEIAPLTEWLADTIDEIAGKDRDDPLTFGDLRNAPRPPELDALTRGEDPTIRRRSIDLRAVTTCLTFGRPLELPFDGTHTLAFDETEWRRIMPGRIVDAMVRAASEIDAACLRVGSKLPFPTGDGMPVVAAARMSLAFPLLFTPVPLYAVDYEDTSTMKRVWFSDGGITSNLPIHRFDALLPRWPTLAINLQYTDADGKPARKLKNKESFVHMIARRQDGVRDLWHVLDQKASPGNDLLGLARAVFRSAQVWHDTSFLKLPGYRDRVVEIWLRPDEGGMNLDMPDHVIDRLIQRGDDAGCTLRDRFARTPPSDPMSWDGHRWVRLRSALAGLTDYLRRFGCSAALESDLQRSLDELLADINAPPTARFRTKTQHEAARNAIEALRAYIEQLDAVTGACTDDDHKGGPCTRPFCRGPRPPVDVGSRAPI